MLQNLVTVQNGPGKINNPRMVASVREQGRGLKPKGSGRHVPEPGLRAEGARPAGFNFLVLYSAWERVLG